MSHELPYPLVLTHFLYLLFFTDPSLTSTFYSSLFPVSSSLSSISRPESVRGPVGFRTIKEKNRDQ